MEIQMSWLHEFVHEVNRVWLVLANQLTPSPKEIICFKTTVLLISIIQNPPDYPTFFLLNHNKQSEEFYHKS